MAIGTDAAIEYFGTQDALDNTSGAVADGAFSVASDLLTWTNDDDARYASVVLECNFATAPDANSSVSLYLQALDVQGLNDAPVPDSNFKHIFVEVFPLNDVTSAQFIPIEIALPNVGAGQVWQPFIQNNAGQSMSAGWDIHITPKAIGPHA
jgi:hypothetical protein